MGPLRVNSMRTLIAARMIMGRMVAVDGTDCCRVVMKAEMNTRGMAISEKVFRCSYDQDDTYL